jgi:DNA processing protein
MERDDQAMNPARKAPWIALQLLSGIGSVTLRRLIDHFGSAEAAMGARRDDLEAIRWLSPRIREVLQKGPDPGAVDRCVTTLEALGAWVLTYLDQAYPPLLREIPDPPPVLYGLGNPAHLCGRSMAIVGSRNASSYGSMAAKKLSAALAREGFTVVSGLALGIDTAAHESALQAGGASVGVKGCGIDYPYPRQNRNLILRMAERGAVITEFPPGVLPEPKNFPIRNRIISGLSMGVIVVEAGLKSGSLISASCALEQGREVMAVPGNIFSPTSRGTHWLIKQGARLVEDLSDVIDELGIQRKNTAPETDPKTRDRATPVLSSEEKALWERLGPYPIHIDDLAHLSGLSVGQVSGLLLQMELKDLVQALPGQLYQQK